MTPLHVDSKGQPTSMVTFATPTGTNNIGIRNRCVPSPATGRNDEICANLDVDSEWIYTRTGIKSRRFCGRDESITTMSVEAGRAALANSGLDRRRYRRPAPGQLQHPRTLYPRPRRRWPPRSVPTGVPAMDKRVWAVPGSATRCRWRRT